MEEKITDKIKHIIAPDVEERIEFKEKINDKIYYILIAIVSVLVVFIPPLCIGSITGDFVFKLPSSPAAWVAWIIIQGSSAIANISILIFFKMQAKKNCSNNANYIKANDILDTIIKKKKTYIPMSPAQMNRRDYLKKVSFIVVFTLCSFFTITNIILAFDILTLISTLVSACITLVVSWFCMLRNEEYWSKEYLLYAEYIEAKFNESEKKKSEESAKTEEGEQNNA